MWAKTQYKSTIQIFRSDGGGEFMSSQLQSYFLSNGIQHQLTCPYTPEQNGVAERKHRHLIDTTRTLLHQANLPYSFWVEALYTALYLINRLPSKALHMISPYQLLNHTPPQYDHLRTFGCACYPWQKPLTPHKLSPRAPLCIFVGYSMASKGYRCFNTHTGKVIVSRHVMFDETKFPTLPTSIAEPSHPSSPSYTPPHLLLPITHSLSSSTPPETSIPSTPLSTSTSATTPPTNPLDSTNSLIISPNAPAPSSPPLMPAPISSSHPMTTRLKAGISRPKVHFNLHSTPTSEIEPQTYSQAAQHPQWRKAMSDEFTALQKQGTWSLVPPPPDCNIIGSRWTFRLKRTADGAIARYKARLVAQGFTQEFGTDFHDTFSPVARLTTVRLFLTVAVTSHWNILQFDVSNAFLHGTLDHTLYMQQPKGFQDVERPHHVCLLHKAIYGLKQAPRLWYSTFSGYLRQQGFQVSTADPSLLIFNTSTTHIYLLFYVDDILITGNDSAFITQLLTQLNQRFHMKSLGNLSSFLGINVTKTTSGLFLNQPAYIQDILHTSGLQNCKPVSTPAALKSAPPEASNLPFHDPTFYRKITGSLQYLTITRPDIAFAVNILCQHMQQPSMHHFQLLKRVLRYLHATPTHGLPISQGPLSLTAYSDADWAGDTDTRRSTTGLCVFLGHTLISWKVHKQKTVARSSTEAEYRALAAATTEVVWLRRLLAEFGHPSPDPTPMFCDNTSAIAIASNPIFHARTKHVEIDFHFVRDHLNNKLIALHHLATSDQPADIFTKPHSTHRFNFLRDKLTVRKPDADFEGG